MNAAARSLEDVLVLGALVDVLEPSPAADVIDEKRGEVGSLGLDIGHELVETLSAGDVQPAAAIRNTPGRSPCCESPRTGE